MGITRMLVGGLLIGVVSVGAAGPASASGRAGAQPLHWAVVPSANRGFGGLGSLSCVSATDCFAVGSRGGPGSFTRTLIESWHGRRFAVVPSPSPSRFDNSLGGISCVSPTFCVTVGNADNNKRDLARTLVESWNGSRWSVVPSPNKGPSSDFDMLGGVSCPSGDLCVSVGSYANVNGQGHTLAEAGTPA